MADFTQFYCCYLLQSVEKRQSFYIGSTPNPSRRLRQHNGDLARGGAYRTKKSGTRPWEMIMVVYGFPNKIVALQFEHAWQHGYKTRFIDNDDRIVTKKNAGSASRNINYKFALIRQLLNNPFFKSMNLGIQFFNLNIQKLFESNKFSIPLDDHYVRFDRINTSESALTLTDYNLKNLTIDNLFEISNKNQELVKCFYQDSIAQDEIFVVRYLERLMDGQISCSICMDIFNYTSEDKDKPFLGFCCNTECRFIAHLSCTFKKFISDYDDNQLRIIPRYGKCPLCSTLMEWTTIVKYSSLIKERCRE